jgi:hypothetical protein
MLQCSVTLNQFQNNIGQQKTDILDEAHSHIDLNLELR